MTIVIAIIAILAAILLPALSKSHPHAQVIRCNINLKNIGLGLRQWALDHGGKMPMTVSITDGGAMEWTEAGDVAPAFQVASNELNTPKILRCPQDDTKKMASTFTNNLSRANISYFLGLDVDETRPRMFLTGDDNLVINGQPVKPGIVALTTNTPVVWSKDRHKKKGYIALADGSVLEYPNSQLQQLLSDDGTNNLRLAFP